MKLQQKYFSQVCPMFLSPELSRVGLQSKFHGESDLKFKARKVLKFRGMGWDGKE